MDADRTDPRRSPLEERLAAGPPGDPADLDRVAEAARRRAVADGAVDVGWAEAEAPFGTVVVAGTAAGLVTLSFEDVDATLERLATRLSPRVLAAPEWTDAVRRQLDEYFAGDRTEFDLRIDWALSRGFRLDALRALTRVGYGEVVTYGELARSAGRPRAARAVGSAMATNPIPIVVPCHRVVPAAGGLGGYGGGVDAKRFLLSLEGAEVEPS